MTTNVLVAAPHNCAGKLVCVEKYDPTQAEESRVYTLVAHLEQGHCEMDWGACVHGNQALRITEVDAPTPVVTE
jgi:hypothetical protein